jgi:hypothetical protein
MICNFLRIDDILLQVLLPHTRCPLCHHFYSQLGNTCSERYRNVLTSCHWTNDTVLTASLFPLFGKNPVLKWWLVLSFPWKMYKDLLTKTPLSHLAFFTLTKVIVIILKLILMNLAYRILTFQVDFPLSLFSRLRHFHRGLEPLHNPRRRWGCIQLWRSHWPPLKRMCFRKLVAEVGVYWEGGVPSLYC